MLGVAGASNVVDASGNKSKPVVMLKGSLDNPLTASDIHDAQDTVRKKYVENNGEEPKAGMPELGENSTPVVAYVAALDKEGAIRHYTGSANSPDLVKSIQKKAAKRLSQYRSGKYESDSSPVATSGVSGNSGLFAYNESFDQSWDFYDHNEWDRAVKPYGVVTSNYELAHLNNDNDSTQDAYAVKHNYNVEPGYSRYPNSNEDWRGSTGNVMHDWGAGDMNADLTNHGPEGKHDESDSVTVNAGISSGGAGAGFGYTYDPGIAVNQDTSYDRNYAGWDVHFNASALCGQKNSGGFDPASSAWVDQPSANSGSDFLFRLASDHKFQACGFSNTKTLDWGWYPNSINY
ncbi:hypothetical protein Halar_1698 [halophilic archaeon DL31]|jgi:hypothetical protein|nr:hypothetical protein Halar_1698 [halophilic archaeon DL31]